jgi:hypothetical protein
MNKGFLENNIASNLHAITRTFKIFIISIVVCVTARYISDEGVLGIFYRIALVISILSFGFTIGGLILVALEYVCKLIFNRK